MTFALDRRHLLKSIALTGLATATGAHAVRALTFFERINRPIGLQLYTLGDEPRKDIDATLARLATIGYHDFELPGLYGLEPAKLKAAADRAGVAYSSIHLAGSNMGQPAGGLTLLSDAAQIAEALGTLGIKQAVLPMLPFPKDFYPNAGESFQAALGRAFAAAGPDIWKKAAALLNERAAALKPHGISLSYHNHNFEFAPIGGTTGFGILARETDPKLVSFEADMGWVCAAGLDPLAFLRRNSGRIRLLHVKDLKASTKTNYALSMDPTEVGSGKLDWKRILPAAHAAGVRHFYVEQEPPFAITRMEAAAKSFGFLNKLVA